MSATKPGSSGILIVKRINFYEQSGDIFDTAVVLSSPYGDTLWDRLNLVSSSKTALIGRIGGTSDEYFNAVMGELEIRSDWQWIVPEARRMVIEMVRAIPPS